MKVKLLGFVALILGVGLAFAGPTPTTTPTPTPKKGERVGATTPTPAARADGLTDAQAAKPVTITLSESKVFTVQSLDRAIAMQERKTSEAVRKLASEQAKLDQLKALREKIATEAKKE